MHWIGWKRLSNRNLGNVVVAEHDRKEEVWLQGRPIVPGIALGLPFLLSQGSSVPQTSDSCILVEEEVKRFYNAVTKSQGELADLAEKLRSKGFCQEADLVNLHLHMAGDPALCSEIEETIRWLNGRYLPRMVTWNCTPVFTTKQ